jgi:hypothetical protein
MELQRTGHYGLQATCLALVATASFRYLRRLRPFAKKQAGKSRGTNSISVPGTRVCRLRIEKFPVILDLGIVASYLSSRTPSRKSAISRKVLKFSSSGRTMIIFHLIIGPAELVGWMDGLSCFRRLLVVARFWNATRKELWGFSPRLLRRRLDVRREGRKWGY